MSITTRKEYDEEEDGLMDGWLGQDRRPGRRNHVSCKKDQSFRKRGVENNNRAFYRCFVTSRERRNNSVEVGVAEVNVLRIV